MSEQTQEPWRGKELGRQGLQQVLSGLKGCSSHSCLIRPPMGMGTNGPCRCNEDRNKMNIVLHRLRALLGPLSPRP
jgi:hypothetical protein